MHQVLAEYSKHIRDAMPMARNLVLRGHFKMGEGNTKEKTLLL